MSEDQKRHSGEAAAKRVEDGMTVGLGTGSTAVWFVRALAERIQAEGLKIVGVPTSRATEGLALELGVRLATLDEVKALDLTVDGADEIGPGLALIKGGGGALLREKLVWEASKRCLVIADASKAVKQLGKFPLPVEVVAFGHATTALRLCDALADSDIGMAPRLRMKGDAPYVTDNGNYIYDIACGVIPDPAHLAEALKGVTGVVEHGLFLDLAEEAILGTDTGVEILFP
jgi:ribose 5-phosphate isomerase A